MTLTARLHRATAALAGIALAVALAGCTLSSETLLIDPTEGQALFEEAVAFAAYDEGEGVLTVAENGPPGDFTFSNGGYVAPDESLTVYFLPPPDGGDYLMLAVLADDAEAMYGIARRDANGITELRLLFESGIEELADRLPAGVAVVDGGLRVQSRADLDAIIPLIADGTLPTAPLVAYIGGDTPPPIIVREATGYRLGQ